jgi:fumarylpyruvate hydrolase
MPQYTFAPVAVASVPMRGEYSRFPVHRIYCVGRNFAEHAKEMGAPVAADKGTPVIFMKPGDAVVTDGHVSYPTQTSDLHHEVELVVALGRDAHGELSVSDAMSLVYAYGVGLDLTRRDLQAVLKDKRLPWDISKGFDASAPISALVPVAEAGLELGDKRLWLEVNGELRQQAPLSDMIFGVAEVLQHLARLYSLRAGDLVYMGTPSGVAALRPGDRFRAGIDGLVEFSGEILPA